MIEDYSALVYKREWYLLVVVIIILFFSSCKEYQAEVPAYIHIDKISVTTDAITQGTTSNNITDAWVYLNGNLIGVYELPATFPIIANGENEISIKAGIKVSGIAASRAYYPFYNPYEITLNLVPDSTITISPVVSYQSWADFPLIEEFNYATSIATFDTTSYSDTTFQTSTNPADVFEGDGSAAIFLDNKNTYFECYTTSNYALPQGGNPVYVEMNYKSEAEIYVGIVGIEGSTLVMIYPSIILSPSEEWNKIYINLTNEVSAEINATEFKIYLAANNTDSLSAATVYIDNFKVVY